MADLGKTQAEWTDLFREFFQYIRPFRILRAFRRRFVLSEIRALELNEGADVLSLWTFVGAERGNNTSEGGRLFVNLNDETPGAGQAQVQVYSDSAKTALVAQGDAADGATVTLAEQNNSGLTGTVLLGTVAASDTDIVLLIDIDEQLKGERAFGISDGSTAAKRKYQDMLVTIEAAIRGLTNARKGDTERNFIRTRMREFLSSGTAAIISATESTDTNGDVQIAFAGLLAELNDAMKDETTAVAQTILENSVTIGTPAFDVDNVGKGTLVTVSSREYARNGTLTFTCTAGKATTLAELFSANFLDEDANPIAASQVMTIKKIWETFRIGARLRLDRIIIETLDGANQVSTYIVNGETLANTDAGKIYLELTDVAGTRTVKWFSDAAKTLQTAEGSRVGDGVVTMTEQNGSGLSGSCVVAFTIDDLDIVVDLQPFAIGDKVSVVITNDEAGVLQTLMKDIWGFTLQSATSPAETLPDTIIKEGVDHIFDVS